MIAGLKQRFAPKVCSWVPLDVWHSLLEVQLVAPHYHVVSDSEVPHVRGLYNFRSVAQFKNDLEFFLGAYSPVSLDDVIAHLEGGCALPKRCFLPSFDDGYREIWEVVAPILRQYGVTAIFFLTTAAIDNRQLCCSEKKSLLLRSLTPRSSGEVERVLETAGIPGENLPDRIRKISYRQRQTLDGCAAAMGLDWKEYLASKQPYVTSEQVRDLRRQGFAIGAHSVDHPPYVELTLAEQLAQTRDSVRWLSRQYEFSCQTFAFPYSDFGVGPEFFEQLFADGQIKVSFGNTGLRKHFCPRHFERFTMEKTDRSASEILARELGVNVWRRLVEN